MVNISPHVSYLEATHTSTGLPNTPTDVELAFMKDVAMACVEPMREHLGRAITINSFFRCDAVNKAVGGASNSQHKFGQAADVTAGSRAENKKLFEWAKANLKFDQLIGEDVNEEGYAWIHISFLRGKNRNEVLYMKKVNGKSTYYK